MALFPNPGPSFRRLKRLAWLFAQSPIFRPATGLFITLMVLLGLQTLIQLNNNKIAGDIVTSIGAGNFPKYAKLAALYLLLYLVLTLVDVTFRFMEERLGLMLRQGLTELLIDRYLGDRAYLRLVGQPEVDNPDQRITEDVKTLTSNALSFLLIVVRAIAYLIVFSAVLQGITPRLLWAAIIYAGVGSIITIVVGKRLVGLNFDQLHKEADLRFELVRTRENARAIALQREENRQGPRLLHRLNEVVMNYRLIIVRNAFLGLCTTSFNYLIIVIPVLIVAPLCFSGDEPIGALAKSADAFRYVVNSFSVLITEFPRLTLLTAVVARLGQLVNAIQAPPKTNGLVVEENGDRLAVNQLTLVDPSDNHRLFAGLSFEVNPGEHLLIMGKPGAGKSELMQAIAGLWPSGNGTIIRPPLDRIAFIPSQPYLTPSTLRQVLTPRDGALANSDDELMDMLTCLHLDELVNRVGGLDVERDWEATLSVGERQALALARLLVLRPRFAILNEVTGGLGGEIRRVFYQRLEEAGVTVITLASRRILPEFHKRQLTLPGDVSRSAGPTAA
jgi:putative ATP-binding cassette transporter